MSSFVAKRISSITAELNDHFGTDPSCLKPLTTQIGVVPTLPNNLIWIPQRFRLMPI